MKKYNVAIIGCGDMGRAHAAAWKLRNDARVAAVFDPLHDRAEAMARDTGAKICASHEEAFSLANFASVYVPIAMHAETAVAAMKRKCHVLCEKALALTEKQALAMIAAAKREGVMLGTSYQYRGFPSFQILRRVLREKELGDGPVFARFTDAREVRPKLAMHTKHLNNGPVLDMCGHYFDLMRFFTGEEAESVHACGHVYGKNKERLKSIASADLAFDAAEITVRYTGGHVLSVFVNWGMPEKHPGAVVSEVWGPDAVARLDGCHVEVAHADRTVRYKADPNPIGPSVRIADVIDAAEGRKPKPEVAGEDGLAALRVCLAALKSIQTGKAVALPA